MKSGETQLYTSDVIEQLQANLELFGNLPVFVNGEYGTDNMIAAISKHISVGLPEIELDDDCLDRSTPSITTKHVLTIGGW